MDNQNTSLPKPITASPQTTPSPAFSTPQPPFLQKVSAWIKNHKRLVLVVVAGIFLAIFIAITIFQEVKNRFFPAPTPPGPVISSPKPATGTTSMILTTSKTTYSLSEKVTLKAIANARGEAIRAFDVVVEYDPEYLSLTNKKSPTLPDFTYYGSNSGKVLKVIAVQKPESTNRQVFKETTLFEFEFTPKKAGKTSFNIVFVPNSTTESNLISEQSVDILTTASGTEIEITN